MNTLTTITKTILGLALSVVLVFTSILVYLALPLAAVFWVIKITAGG